MTRAADRGALRYYQQALDALLLTNVMFVSDWV